MLNRLEITTLMWKIVEETYALGRIRRGAGAGNRCERYAAWRLLFVYQFIECSDTMCTSEILIDSPNAYTNDDDPPAPRIINLVAIGELSRRHRHT